MTLKLVEGALRTGFVTRSPNDNAMENGVCHASLSPAKTITAKDIRLMIVMSASCLMLFMWALDDNKRQSTFTYIDVFDVLIFHGKNMKRERVANILCVDIPLQHICFAILENDNTHCIVRQTGIENFPLSFKKTVIRDGMSKICWVFDRVFDLEYPW